MTPESQLYLRAPVRKIDTGTAVVAVRQFGAGAPLLLIHGFPLHGYTWRKLLPALSQRFTCIVADLPGKGDSDWSGRTDFSFEGHAANLQLVMDRLGLGPYRVMAQDTGATVARCLALRDPRVQKLVLLNTEIPGHRPPWIREYQFLMKLPGTELMFRQLLRSRVFLRSSMGFGGCFCNLDLIDGEFREHFVQPYVESARRTEGMGKYLVGLTWPVVDSLAHGHAGLKMPVQLIWGEDDPTFPVERARAMAVQFPDATFVTVPNTKLLPHEERPEEVLRHTLPFLAAA